MTGYFIGLDCGGTKTRGVLGDEELKILTSATGGPGNPLSAGMSVAARSYGSVIRQLLRKARLRPIEIRGLGVGAAGAGREADRQRIAKVFRRLLPGARISVDTDGMIALLGATQGRPGINVIAGTGSFVLGMDHTGKQVRGGGWGPLLGDEGSGATMGREALQAVFRAEDGRQPATALRSVILRHYGVRTPEDLVTHIYRNPPTARDFAELWPFLLRAAEAGDRAARDILRKGGEELAQTVIAVANRLDFRGERIPLILTGGVLCQRSLLRRTLLRLLKESLPQITRIDPAAPPEVGALHLSRGRR